MKMPPFSLPAHQKYSSNTKQSREKHLPRHYQELLSSFDEEDRDDMTISQENSPQRKDHSPSPLSHLIRPVPSSISVPALSVAANGWRTINQLRQIAALHNGMAIQYRILYSNKEIKDHNPGSTEPIPPNVLVVQSRFATKTRSSGGCSYRLRDWILPGGLKLRKAQHMTIYRDTRPSFYEDGVADNAFPVIVLDPGIPSKHVNTLRQFFAEGDSGKTITMFCNVHDLEVPDVKDDVAIAGLVEVLHQGEHQHAIINSADDDDERGFDFSPNQSCNVKRNDMKKTIFTDSRRCGVGAWVIVFGVLSCMLPSCHRLPSSYNARTLSIRHNGTAACLDLAAKLLVPVNPHQVEVKADESIGGFSSANILSWEMLSLYGWL